MSVGCAFESRRGHFLFSAFEPPWRGQVSSLRVLLAPGAFLLTAFEPTQGRLRQSVARSSSAGGISIGCLSDYCLRVPAGGLRHSVARTSRAGGISFFCLRTPVEGTGQQLARSSRAGGISICCLSDYCLRTPAGETASVGCAFESRRGHEGTVSVNCAETLR